MSGKPYTKERRLNHSELAKSKGYGKWMNGRKFSKETRRKMSERMRLQNKKKVLDGTHNFWKGGVTIDNKIVRSSVEYREWRTAVFKRDDFTCTWCGQKGGELNADHIKPFASYRKLRFKLSNGRTLCVGCHRKTDTYAVHSAKETIHFLEDHIALIKF